MTATSTYTTLVLTQSMNVPAEGNEEACGTLRMPPTIKPPIVRYVNKLRTKARIAEFRPIRIPLKTVNPRNQIRPFPAIPAVNVTARPNI